MVVFEIGSLVCATAPSSVGFIVGRAIAGAGAAGCFTGGFSIVVASAPLAKRSIYISILQSTFGIATILGPLLGGALTERATWRKCFYIDLPIGAITIGFLLFFFHPPKIRNDSTSIQRLESLDLVGTCLFAPSAIMLLIAVQWGCNEYSWSSATIIGLLVGAGVLALLFIFWQIREGDNAMIPPKLFTQRTVFFACATEFFAMGPVYISIYHLPQWFQIVKGASPTRSGLMYLPLSISDILSAIVTGSSLPYVGLPNPFILTGTALLSIGAGMLSTLSVNSGSQYWIPYQILPGLRAGITLSMPYVAIQTVLKPEDIPIATSLLQLFQFFGAAIFLASAQAVFTSRFYTPLKATGIAQADFSSIIHAAPTQFRELIPKDRLASVLDAYNEGVTGTFYLSAGLAATACFLSLGLQWRSVKPKAE